MNLPFMSKSNGEEDNFNPFPDLPSGENANRNAAKDYALLSFSLLLLASSIITYGYFSSKLSPPGLDRESDFKSTQVKPTPTPRPIIQGEETYSISQSDPAGPRISKAYISNHDPKISEDQTIRVTTSHDQGVKKVTIIISTDNDNITIPLKIVEGDNRDGIWEGSWKVSGTVLYNYTVGIEAESEDGSSKVEISIR